MSYFKRLLTPTPILTGLAIPFTYVYFDSKKSKINKININEVNNHKTEKDMWVTYNNKVYYVLVKKIVLMLLKL